MPGTCTQIYIQIVFAVQGRGNLIATLWQNQLNKYISGIITRKGQKSIIVNGIPDHIHVFAGLKPSMAVSDLARDIKNNSSKFINKKGFVTGQFAWQEGYGAFSDAHSQLETVCQSIVNREQHHRRKTFQEPFSKRFILFKVKEGDKCNRGNIWNISRIKF